MIAARNQASTPTSDHGDIAGGRQHGALFTRLERGAIRGDGTCASCDEDATAAAAIGGNLPRWIERLLRIPLPVKLVGANLLLLVGATATGLVVRHRELSTAPVLTVVIVAFLAAILLNTALVMLAVRPLRALEKTVDTIWQGDLGARVPISVLADRHVMRVARMFNILLDGLVSDRARTRRLATELITAADRERAAISRELHDSAAQSLAALVMQLSVGVQATDTAPREVVKERIEGARLLAISTLEEVRLLAHTMHPRVLDDLGLIAALKRLARDTTEHIANYVSSPEDSGVVVEVIAGDASDELIPPAVMSVLYRVAQEAVQNSRRHAAPQRVEIRFKRDLETASIEIVDDGRGFDPETVHGERAGIGLFTMRERVALVDGDFQIHSHPGGGTSVLASIPLHPISQSPLTRFQT